MNRLSNIVAALGLTLIIDAAAQHVRIDRCEPATFVPGTATEITLHGRNLDGAEIWTSFPSTVERLDDKAPKFRITTNHTGTGALRAHTNQGTSNLSFVNCRSARQGVVASAKKARHVEAQAVHTPCVIEGTTDNLAASFYRFAAQGGQDIAITARARGSDFDGVITIRDASGQLRLAFADDDEVTGADPRLVFTAPADGDYVLELIDSQYRGGKNYELEIGGEVAIPPVFDATTTDPFAGALPATVSGSFDSADPDLFVFDVPAGTFLTITPHARSIASASTLRLGLSDKEGKTHAETPQDAFDERALRLKVDKDSSFTLAVEDAFGRYGKRYFYGIEISNQVPPFALSIPREGDKKKPLRDNYVATPGGVFRVPVQVQRHGFDREIDLVVEGWELENPQIESGQNGTDLRVRVPDDAKIGDLLTIRVSGSAQAGAQQFTSALRSADALGERHGGVEIPENVDGQLAVRIIACPLGIEVAAPAEAKPGSSAKVPVSLLWRDEQRKFNANFKIIGAPPGIESPDQSLKINEGTERELELKIGKDVTDLSDLRVEIGIDYYGQRLWVRSSPFGINLPAALAAKQNNE